MGTNYYARVDYCPCCGRHETLHICKSLTTFQGFPDDEAFPNVRLTTWAEWKAFLRDRVDLITDEYGTVFDFAVFVALVEASPPEARRGMYQWLVDNNRSLDGDWLDPDGFSFTSTEFS